VRKIRYVIRTFNAETLVLYGRAERVDGTINHG